MQRRGFVTALGGGLAASLMTPQAGRTSDQHMKVLHSRVVNRELFKSKVEPGDVLNVRKAAERRFDPASLILENGKGEAVGYLPPVSTRVLASLIDNGHRSFALVADQGVDPELSVDVYLQLGRISA